MFHFKWRDSPLGVHLKQRDCPSIQHISAFITNFTIMSRWFILIKYQWWNSGDKISSFNLQERLMILYGWQFLVLSVFNMNVGHFSHEGGNIKHILHQDQFHNWMLENKTEQNKPKTMLAEISRYNTRAMSSVPPHTHTPQPIQFYSVFI